jgi:hypothetical protein
MRPQRKKKIETDKKEKKNQEQYSSQYKRDTKKSEYITTPRHHSTDLFALAPSVPPLLAPLDPPHIVHWRPRPQGFVAWIPQLAFSAFRWVFLASVHRSCSRSYFRWRKMMTSRLSSSTFRLSAHLLIMLLPPFREMLGIVMKRRRLSIGFRASGPSK